MSAKLGRGSNETQQREQAAGGMQGVGGPSFHFVLNQPHVVQGNTEILGISSRRFVATLPSQGYNDRVLREAQKAAGRVEHVRPASQASWFRGQRGKGRGGCNATEEVPFIFLIGAKFVSIS